VFLAAANSAVGPEIAQAFVDGQLYFTGWPQLRTVAMVAVLAFVFLAFLSRHLLVDRFFPDHFKANQIPGWRYHLFFDVMVAIMTLPFGAAMVGVMATFVFVFIPSWFAFRRAKGWRNGLSLGVAFSTTGYLAGFVLAILFDQPFGPAQVMVLLILALGARFLEWIQAGTPTRRET